VDGRHKAGHDDQGMEMTIATEQESLASIPDHLSIVMAGLVPAIHGFLSFAGAWKEPYPEAARWEREGSPAGRRQRKFWLTFAILIRCSDNLQSREATRK
jgi:hypothetical protein